MKKKKILTLSGIVLGIAMCFSFNKVQAIESAFTGEKITRNSIKTVAQANTLSESNPIVPLTVRITASNYKTNTGKIYWVLNDEANIYKDLYCLNVSKGFGAPNGEVNDSNDTKIYKNQYDLNNLTEEQQGYLGISDETTFNKVKWVLNNIATSEGDLTEFLTKASKKVNISSIGLAGEEEENFIKNDMAQNTRESTAISFEDVKMVQQVVVWHFTNPSSIFEDTLVGISYADGRQISGLQEEQIEIEEAGTAIWNGKIKQAKFNAIYDYLVDGADSATKNLEKPTLTINSSSAIVKESEDSNYFIAGPYLLTGTNTDRIKKISYQPFVNGGIFVDKEGTEITNIKSYIGNNDGIYFRIPKNNITESNIDKNIILTYTYDNKEIIFMTDVEDLENTQPIATVKDAEENISIDINVKFELIYVMVAKEWEDANNQDGLRPSEVKVQLYQDGEARGEIITLNESNNWKYNWEKLLSGKNYEVKELDSSNNIVENNGKYNENYTASYEYPETGIPGCLPVIVTNIHTPEVITKTVTKIWNDANNQDGKRPQSIQVQLLANGQPKGDKVTILDNNGQWSYTWNNLPKNENGKEITYTVVEDEINEYVTTYSDDTFTITNSYTPGKVSNTVIKVWNDQENLDKIRPEEVTVTLYKVVNGQEIEINSQKLSQENNWRYTWEDLDEKQNGEDIVYLVKETNVDGYTTAYTAENYTNTNTITITNTHIPVIKGNYSVVLRKVDNNRNELGGAIISINGKDYTVGNTKLVEKEEILQEEDIVLTYEVEEKTAPEDYVGLVEKRIVKIKLEVEKLGTTYNIKRAYFIDNEGNQISNTDMYIDLDITSNTITLNIINTPEIKELDLALRKFITSITSEDGKKSDTYNREPVVDSTIIGTVNSNGEIITTATYKHTKEPIAVEVGDIVTYTIRVYNEGEADGYVSQIKDHLPEYLDFLPDDELNQKYLWQQDINNNRIITTSVAAKDSANGENIYSNRENKQLLSGYEGRENLDYIDFEIRCKVNEKAKEGQLITNIADISGMQDKFGTELIKDIDSEKDNVEIPEDITLPNYIGDEENKTDLTDKDYYYKGQEDDDDFEKLLVRKFDLSLRKFIIAVNGTELKSDVIEGNVYTREPKVDTSKLGTKDENGNVITTATYIHPKEPVEVKKGDIVTYIIRVYNEGSLAGYANEIIENIPEGLEFVADSEINKQYGWILREDGKLVTSYLSNNIINNVIEDINQNKILDYKDVQVELKVVANASDYTGDIITNWAEINIESNKDIDSIPGNDIKTEDDIDYEPVKLVYFDLALRKFITNVDGTEYNNRVPEVDTSKLGTVDEITGEKITTAEYKHTKDPVVLETGSTVIYTIRVYNEGLIAGYANEIVDNLPEGLEFLPENQINIDYKWTMIDEEGNITQDVSKAKKITTNYLSENNDSTKIIDGYKNENNAKTLSYQDIKVAFKVIEPNSSNRIVINTAEISKASMEDIDSIPGNNIPEEDDIDNEYLRVETFDLALEKWVKATKVTYKGKTKTTKTGFTAESTEMAKVDLIASQLSKTTVKFVYCIRVINEGQVAGYATEIKDYVPSGLKFVAKDNPNWVYDEKDDSVTTTQLKDKLLEPGQSETIEIVLTWKNSTSNMGVKTNWAEISADSGEDIDSTPDNYNKIEDDIDDAKVILSIKTGGTKTYVALAIAAIVILGGGAYLVKKKVLVK